MAVIGNSAVGVGTVSETNTAKQLLIKNASYTYTAAANQEVFKFWFYCGNTYTGDGTGVELAVYDISGGVSGATKVATGTVIPTATLTWASVSVTPVALTQGNVYALAMRVKSATSVSQRYTYVGAGVSRSSLAGSSAFASTWTDNANDGNAVSAYAETQTAAITGLSITSVTPSSFDDGRTGIVIAGSGFGASQGSSTLTIGGQAQTVTAWSDTSITFTSARGSVSPGNATLTLTKG